MSSKSMPFLHQVVSWIVTTVWNLDETHFIRFLLTVACISNVKFVRRYRAHLSLLATTSIFLYCYYKNPFPLSGTDVKNEKQPSRSFHDDFYEDKRHTLKPILSAGQLVFSNGSWKSQSNNYNVRFRGINLPAKTPSIPSALKTTKNSDGSLLYRTKESVSFVNRPFPLETADEHFQRLALYGLNLIRLSVTWEAVMHEGPGIIDEHYLEYLSDLVDKAAEYGFYIIIDPHQDVWSRFTGGDGAPWWTLDVVGFKTNDSSIHDSGCSWLHQHFEDEYPDMFWITNYYGLTTATMFTLFFAGDIYAPGIYARYENGTNVSVQTFLQGYYFDFINVVAQTLKNKWNILGFNSMNEPSQGYVGLDDLRKSILPIPMGYVQSAFDGMRLSSGETMQIDYYPSVFRFEKTKAVNIEGKTPWKTPEHDIWKKLGVYDIQKETNERILQKPNYFKFDGGMFEDEFLLPFYEKLQNVITKHNERFILYAEPHVTDKIHFAPKELDPNKFAWAPHWYDAFVIMVKRYVSWFAIRVDTFVPVVGSYFIDKAFEANLKMLKKSGNNLHVIIGETGMPFDLYPSDDDAIDANHALDRTLQAMEANNLEYILWNYKYDNDDKDGDGWNKENFSIRANGMNRGISKVSRPFVYMHDYNLEIGCQKFDSVSQHFTLSVRKADNKYGDLRKMKVMIYIPEIHFSNPIVKTSFGDIDYVTESQTIIWSLPKVKNENAILTIENKS